MYFVTSFAMPTNKRHEGVLLVQVDRTEKADFLHEAPQAPVGTFLLA
jgi:hypothetical protein